MDLELQKLAALPAKKRLELLTESDDALERVRAIEPELLYRTIAEVGIADATELVQLSSPEQFQALVDLGSWKRDQLEPHRLLTWIRAARPGPEGAHEEFLAKLHGVDLELIELLLRNFTVVHSLEENPDVNPEGVTVESPDGAFLIELKVDGVEGAAMRTLLNDLFAQGPLEASRLIEAARWELMGELEETAYRFRVARLADLGFPDPEAAVSIFAFRDPDPYRAPALESGSLESTQAALARMEPRALDAAFAALPEASREAWEASLRTVANSALVAEGADPGDLEAVSRVAEGVRDTLSLAFEWMTGGDPSRANKALELPVRTLFQVGFSLVLRLKHRADRWARLPGAVLDGRLFLLPEEASVVSALRRKRPLRGLKFAGTEPVPFRSLRELAEAALVLERAERQRTLFWPWLGGEVEKARSTLGLIGIGATPGGPEELLAAVVAQALLGRPAQATPLREEMLPRLLERLFDVESEAPRVSAAARETVRARLSEGAAPEGAAEAIRLADLQLDRFREAWGATYKAEGRVDPRVAATLVPLEPAISP